MTNKWLVPIVVGAAITIAVGLGGWNLVETASIPKVYSTKAETDKKVEDFKAQHDKRHDESEKNIQRNFDQMFQIQRDMQSSVDELNRKVK